MLILFTVGLLLTLNIISNGQALTRDLQSSPESDNPPLVIAPISNNSISIDKTQVR